MTTIREILDTLDDIGMEPEVGDTVAIECGDTLIETHITEVLEDGVVLHLDEGALRIMIDGARTLREGSYGPDAQFPYEEPKPRGTPERIKSDYLSQIARARAKGHHEQADEMAADLERRLSMPRYDEFMKKADELHAKILASTGDEKTRLQRELDALHDRASHGLLPENLDEAKKRGLWANIHAKRERIKAGSGERMRKPGSPGAPTAKNFRDAQGTSESVEVDEETRMFLDDEQLDEAEYRGRKVPLGKPMKGDVKKSKVYVKKPNGTVVKVNFGDKNMRIKKNIPGRRKSFRARHNCDNPGPRWRARYWSCRAW